MNRLNECGDTPNRNKRFYKSEGYWYYTTREQVVIGPFDSLHAAEEGACAYVDFIIHAEPGVLDALKKYQPSI